MALIERDDATAHIVYHLTVVRSNEHGSTCAIDAFEQIHDAPRVLRVKITCWFVANEQGWTIDDRTRDANALLLAARKLVRKLIELVCQTNQAAEPQALAYE